MYVCGFFFSPKPGRLNTQTLIHHHSTLNVCSYTHLHLTGTIRTGAGGGAVPCLRGPQWGLLRGGGALNNFNPLFSPLYTCVLHQDVVMHRYGCDSALFLANCHHITPWFLHIVTEPRRGMLQQNMTKYFSRADGQDFVSTGRLSRRWILKLPACLLQHFDQQGVGEESRTNYTEDER